MPAAGSQVLALLLETIGSKFELPMSKVVTDWSFFSRRAPAMKRQAPRLRSALRNMLVMVCSAK